MAAVECELIYSDDQDGDDRDYQEPVSPGLEEPQTSPEEATLSEGDDNSEWDRSSAFLCEDSLSKRQPGSNDASRRLETTEQCQIIFPGSSQLTTSVNFDVPPSKETYSQKLFCLAIRLNASRPRTRSVRISENEEVQNKLLKSSLGRFLMFRNDPDDRRNEEPDHPPSVLGILLIPSTAGDSYNRVGTFNLTGDDVSTICLSWAMEEVVIT